MPYVVRIFVIPMLLTIAAIFTLITSNDLIARESGFLFAILLGYVGVSLIVAAFMIAVLGVRKYKRRQIAK